jgi:hypothetical protein
MMIMKEKRMERGARRARRRWGTEQKRLLSQDKRSSVIPAAKTLRIIKIVLLCVNTRN